jgi:hypothetical protein
VTVKLSEGSPRSLSARRFGTELRRAMVTRRHVISSRPVRPTPCELPHFTKAGELRAVPGQVYRWADGSQVLCVAHGKALIDRISGEVPTEPDAS